MFSRLKDVVGYLALFVLFVLVSVVFEVIVFNYRLLIDKNSKEVIDVISYDEKRIDGNNIVSFNLEGKYVEKLKITYSTDEDIRFTLKYVSDNYYGNEEVNTVYDTFDNEVVEEVNNIRGNLDNVEIVYSDKFDLEIKSIIIDNRLDINIFRVFFVSIVMVLGYIIYRFYKKGGSIYNIHRYFVFIGLLLGSTIIVLQPSATYYSWDDQIHFLNVYEIFDANGIWSVGEVAMIDSSPVGRDSISSIEEQMNMNNYLNMDKNGNYMSFKSKFITYNKIAYLPSAIGFHICKMLDLPFVISFKVGKIMNLLTYLLIFSYAIKITKTLKRFLIVLGLIPTNLFLATQYSYDPVVVAGITLGIVLLYNVVTDKDSKVDFKFMILFLFSMLYGCFPKAVYAPLMLGLLFIPKEKFKNKNQCRFAKIGIVVITILMMATFVLPTVSNNVEGDTRGGATSVTEQLKLIISNPGGYVMVLKDTMGRRLFSNFISKKALVNFSYMSDPSDNAYYLYLLLLFWVAIMDNWNSDKVKSFFRIFNLGLIFGVVLLIWTALYLSFTPVGLTTINGVQERYFLPLILPLLLCIKTKNMHFKINDKLCNLLVLGVPIIVLLIEIFNIILVPYCF